uniref:TetR/AcrR family transcriptional regulator n=1 Tax=Pseudomonas purpurea TaxID=3136737 RepID=UPI003F586F0D
MQRPRQIEKRDTILQAAAQLFLQNGYSRVSVDEVVAAIGGSKRTIYAYFGDKDGLFASIVEQLCNEIVTPLVVLDIKRLPLRDALQRIASTFLDVVLSPKAIALHRLVIAEANRAPESARMFFAAAPTTSYRCLADYFNWGRWRWSGHTRRCPGPCGDLSRCLDRRPATALPAGVAQHSLTSGERSPDYPGHRNLPRRRGLGRVFLDELNSLHRQARSPRQP